MVKKPLGKAKTDYQFSTINNLLNKLYSFKNFHSSKKFYIILIILGLLLLVTFKKSLFLAALVNGSPITNLALQIRLNQQFRTQTLNQLINEKIILDEAAKNNASISEAEVSRKIQEVETSLGGAQSLDNILASQGQTRENIRQQIKLQLSIEKLYAKDATISAQEVDKFLETSQNQLKATDSASQTKEAENLLKQQKLSQIFNERFTELRQKAKIQIF